MAQFSPSFSQPFFSVERTSFGWPAHHHVGGHQDGDILCFHLRYDGHVHEPEWGSTCRHPRFETKFWAAKTKQSCEKSQLFWLLWFFVLDSDFQKHEGWKLQLCATSNVIWMIWHIWNKNGLHFWDGTHWKPLRLISPRNPEGSRTVSTLSNKSCANGTQSATTFALEPYGNIVDVAAPTQMVKTCFQNLLQLIPKI